jgi:hypothetical protein
LKTIPLTRGFVALVDDEDFPAVKNLKWHVRLEGGRAYAAHSVTGGGAIMMHRLLLGYPESRVDHVQHRTSEGVVDNTRGNLRLVTAEQNNANARKWAARPTKSVFKGVTWHRRDSVWEAAIRVKGRLRYLGRFREEAHAAYAYDVAAVAHFGDYALPNFLVPGSRQALHGG